MSERNSFILVNPSPIVLPGNFGLRRVPPRRPQDMQAHYLDNFDFTTLYYDVFETTDGIVGIGPPMRNLKDFAEQSLVKIDDVSARLEVIDLDRVQVSSFLSNSIDNGVLSFNHELGSISCEIGRNIETIFQGKNVVMTKSKNNSITWIYDWAQFYVANHNVNGVVIYDNGSTEYAATDILNALREIKGLQACAVVNWNYPWGAPGGVWAGNRDVPWDSDFCQYGAMEHARRRLLRGAQIVINHDIDELLVSKSGRGVGKILTDMGVAGIEYSGRWIETVGSPPEGEPRFANFRYYNKDRGACTKKWVIVPKLAESAKQWKLHSVEGLRLAKADDLSHRHFMGISNNWKHNRTKATEYDKEKHIIDGNLAIAMDKAFGFNGGGFEKTPHLQQERCLVNETDNNQKIVPHMPTAAITILQQKLKDAECYLEYGSGGSTVLAADQGVPQIISVDTSAEWFEKVRASIDAGYSGTLKTLYIDIGPTKKWGYPVSDSSFKSWPLYFFSPWEYIRQNGMSPDLILIDGRFRVSCFLASLAHASIGTTLLFDDYVNRKYYHTVEELLKPVNFYDRMAEFVKVSEPSAETLLAMAGRFFFDTR